MVPKLTVDVLIRSFHLWPNPMKQFWAMIIVCIVWVVWLLSLVAVPAPVYASDCDPKNDIMLNLDIPFIGRCIKKKVTGWSDEVTYSSVFPKLVWGMARIVMTAIIIVGFLWILVGWFMIASNGAFGTREKGKKLIISILAGFLLLGASGIILNLINPAFFGTGS